MEIIFELVFGFILEIVMQLVAEVLTACGIHGVKRFRGEYKSVNPLLSFLGYILFGAILGGVSLIIIPRPILTRREWSIIHLIVTPIVVGLVMARVGNHRKKKDKDIIRLESFAHGWIFALAFALVRFFILT